MSQLNALDLMSVMPQINSSQMVANRSHMHQGLFSLVCAVEMFEDLVGESHRDLAEALYTTTTRLYELIREDSSAETNVVIHPQQIEQAFSRFENVFLILNEFYAEFAGENWRTQITWRNIQDLYTSVKTVLVKKSRNGFYS